MTTVTYVDTCEHPKSAKGVRRCSACRANNALLCTKCKVQLRMYPGTTRSYCADCMADYQRKAKYGITPDQFAFLLLKQDGACAICKTEFDMEAKMETKAGLRRGRDFPRVDHDHVTGEVRGLLCYSCNVAIGLMQDDEERLLAAIEYLGRSSQ